MHKFQDLRRSEEFFKTLINESLVGICIIQDEMIKYANSRISEIFGYSIEEIKSWPKTGFMKIIHPDCHDKFSNQISKTDHEKLTPKCEIKGIRKSGDIVCVEISSKAIVYERNTANYTTIIEITNRKKIEMELKESEEKFRNITEQFLMGVCILQDDVIKYVNKKYANICGYTIEEMLNWKPREYTKAIHPEDHQWVIEQATKKQEGSKDTIKHYTFRGIRKSGETIWVENYADTIIFNGSPADLIAIVDITDRKKAEQKLNESEKKYQEAFNRAEFYKDLFAHDLNNILQSALSSTELCLKFIDLNQSTKEIKDLLNNTKEAMYKAGNLIFNVQTLSLLEKKKIIFKPIDVYKVLNKVVENISKIYKEYKNFHIIPPDLKVQVNANEFFHNVLENLLVNAIKHNKKQIIEIYIKISKEKKEGIKYIKIEIGDNGFGIEDSRKNIIFTRNNYVDKKENGIGLGLSLVKNIIKGYKGQIWVEDRIKGDYTKGSNFVLLIPEAVEVIPHLENLLI